MRSMDQRANADGGDGLRVGGSAAGARLRWMDLMRGVAVLLVVAYHAAYLTVDRGGLAVPAWVELLSAQLAPFRMPVLVMLSGLLLGPSLAKGWRRFFEGKIRRIAWPYLVWTAVIAALYWPAPVIAYLRGSTYLWFLLFLLIYFAAAWALRWAPPVLVVGAAYAASVAAPADTKYVERLLYLFALFMLGHVLASTARGRTVLTHRWSPLVGAAMIALHYAVVGGNGYRPTSVLASVGFLLLGGWVARLVADRAAARPLCFAGQQSLVYYVVHFPVIIVTIEVLERVGLAQGVLMSVAGLLVAVVAATAAALAAARAPLVRWLFVLPRVRAPRLTYASRAEQPS